MVQAKVTLTFPETLQFIAETGSGHRMILDGPATNTGPKPIELVAVALAGCTAFDVATILRSKKHKRISAYEVSVEAEQQQFPPQVISKVRIHHSIKGDELDAKSVEDAIELSEVKYCSVGAIVRQSGAEIVTTYAIQSAEEIEVGSMHAAVS
ncbi:MAG TPA: OsmC family protein [Candidatus Angelobacter sp.]|nr:OsmC family protein [Candidatus Angelobacter sp.]